MASRPGRAVFRGLAAAGGGALLTALVLRQAGPGAAAPRLAAAGAEVARSDSGLVVATAVEPASTKVKGESLVEAAPAAGAREAATAAEPHEASRAATPDPSLTSVSDLGQSVSVKVSSEPFGAQVFIERKPFGVTPTSIRFRPGVVYQVRFDLPGYESVERRVYTSQRTNQTLDVALRKAP